MTLPTPRNSLPPGTAERVRCIIEDAFGPGYWDGFQGYICEDSAHGKEWRFGGQLGFGGKVYLNAARLYVGCYPADATPVLTNRMAQVNALLEAIYDALLTKGAVAMGEHTQAYLDAWGQAEWVAELRRHLLEQWDIDTRWLKDDALVAVVKHYARAWLTPAEAAELIGGWGIGDREERRSEPPPMVPTAAPPPHLNRPG